MRYWTPSIGDVMASRGAGTVLEMGCTNRQKKKISGAPHFRAVPIVVSGYAFPILFACGRCTNRPIGLMLTDDGDSSYSLAKKRHFLQG